MWFNQLRTMISIHALREEGDLADIFVCRLPCISIHALREEGDTTVYDLIIGMFAFQSTPSVRRATEHRTAVFFYTSYFNPRPP